MAGTAPPHRHARAPDVATGEAAVVPRGATRCLAPLGPLGGHQGLRAPAADRDPGGRRVDRVGYRVVRPGGARLGRRGPRAGRAPAGPAADPVLHHGRGHPPRPGCCRGVGAARRHTGDRRRQRRGVGEPRGGGRHPGVGRLLDRHQRGDPGRRRRAAGRRAGERVLLRARPGPLGRRRGHEQRWERAALARARGRRRPGRPGQGADGAGGDGSPGRRGPADAAVPGR